MSYHVGVGPGMGALGWKPCDPQIVCDDCGTARVFTSLPPKWFFDGKAPPGWKKVHDPGCRRLDFCPKCKGGISGGGSFSKGSK